MKVAAAWLLVAVVSEICLGGGGRLTAWGFVSLRMVLFCLAMMVTAILLIRGERMPREYRFLVLLFIGISGIGIVVGLTNGAEFSFWWEDIKPLLYFLMLPFFHFAMKDGRTVALSATTIKTISLVLAGAFFITLAAIHGGLIPFQSFYRPAVATTEFFFRGEVTFFYKGFLYLCVGAIFLYFTGSRSKGLWISVLFLAILLSFTRGFLFALGATYCLYFILKAKPIKAVAGAMAAAVIIIFGQSAISSLSREINELKNGNRQSALAGTLLGDRSYSDSERRKQIEQVFARVTPQSLIVGHGFGRGIPSRPVHMEISYLEIFHKQGILGLAFWGYLLYALWVRYRKRPDTAIRSAFFFSAVFLFFFSRRPINMSTTRLVWLWCFWLLSH